MTENYYIYGKNSVLEALESGTRSFNRILIADTMHRDEKIETIKSLAQKSGVIFQFVKKEKINNIAPNVQHQGILALLSPIKYADLDDFLNRYKDEYVSVIVLDGIEDPHNLGAIIRTAVCAGVQGIIIPSRHGAVVNSIVDKTSAGAVNYISVIKVNSLVSAVQKLKEHNYWVIASDHHAEDNYFDIDYKEMNFALIMGAEHTGISKSLLNISDFKVKIPMLTNFNSLNVSNAAAIILFESVRQKLKNCQI